MVAKELGKSILLVDDSPDTLDVLQRNLAGRGYVVASASSAGEAIKRLAADRFDLVITDMRMPELSGLDLLRHVRETLPETEVMMITGYATIENAVEAVKRGAGEYLAKPFTDDELFAAVARSFAHLDARRAVHAPEGRFGLVGESDAMRRAFAVMERAARVKGPVFLLGEGGSGRKAAARAIAAARGLSTALHMIGRPREGEVFRLGRNPDDVHFIHGLEWLGPEEQARLLEVVESNGANGPQLFVSAGPELPVLVEMGGFRADLHARLAAVTILMPPLRERGDDAALLTAHFASELAGRLGQAVPVFTSAALAALGEYSWPGNVEELKAAVLSAICRSAGGAVDWKHWPASVRAASATHWTEQTLADVEADHILRVLARAGGNKSRTAEILGIDRKTLREKLKALGGDREE